MSVQVCAHPRRLAFDDCQIGIEGNPLIRRALGAVTTLRNRKIKIDGQSVAIRSDKTDAPVECLC